MDSRRAQSGFALFALSAMFASVAVITAPSVRAQASAPSAGPLSDAQFQKIVAIIRRTHGKPADVKTEVADALGLENRGKAATLGHFAMSDKQGTMYQMSLLDKGKGYLVTRHTRSGSRIFLMDANRSLVSGLTVESGQSPAVMSANDAASLFQQDLAAWAAISDSIPAKAPKSGTKN
jgi:hypothetical protein